VNRWTAVIDESGVGRAEVVPSLIEGRLNAKGGAFLNGPDQYGAATASRTAPLQRPTRLPHCLRQGQGRPQDRHLRGSIRAA